MTTKKNPNAFYSYAEAHPDEPIFVLFGRDPQAAGLVRLWASGRDFLEGEDDPKVAMAHKCADAMERWYTTRAQESPLNILTLLPFEVLASELRRRGATIKTAGRDDDDDRGDSLDLDS